MIKNSARQPWQTEPSNIDLMCHHGLTEKLETSTAIILHAGWPASSYMQQRTIFHANPRQNGMSYKYGDGSLRKAGAPAVRLWGEHMVARIARHTPKWLHALHSAEHQPPVQREISGCRDRGSCRNGCQFDHQVSLQAVLTKRNLNWSRYPTSVRKGKMSAYAMMEKVH